MHRAETESSSEMSGYTPRENTLATAIDRIEDLRDAVQAQTQGLYKLIETMQAFGARLERMEKALTAEAAGDNKLEQLLRSLVVADRSHAEALHEIHQALLQLPEQIAAAAAVP